MESNGTTRRAENTTERTRGSNTSTAGGQRSQRTVEYSTLTGHRPMQTTRARMYLPAYFRYDPRAASFVRPKKVQYGCTVPEAICERYGPPPPPPPSSSGDGVADVMGVYEDRYAGDSLQG